MKNIITKTLLLIIIMSVSVFFTGCNKNDKTTDQDNNGQSNNSSISPVSEQNDETDLATGEDAEDPSSDSDQLEKKDEQDEDDINESQSQDDEILKAAREYLEEYISNAGTDLKITGLKIQIKKDAVALVSCSSATQDSYEMEPVSVVVEMEGGLWKGQKLVPDNGLSFLPCDYPDLYSKERVDECEASKEMFMKAMR